jgi:hypothetical protein
MVAKSIYGRLACVCALLAIVLLACRFVIAAPGAGWQCYTFGVAMDAECSCPIEGDAPHAYDFCSNTRPNLWQSDGTMIYLPYCMDISNPEINCDEPVFPCGAQIWKCDNVICTGNSETVVPSCHLTPKDGCEGTFGCAGS